MLKHVFAHYQSLLQDMVVLPQGMNFDPDWALIPLDRYVREVRARAHAYNAMKRTAKPARARYIGFDEDGVPLWGHPAHQTLDAFHVIELHPGDALNDFGPFDIVVSGRGVSPLDTLPDWRRRHEGRMGVKPS